MTINRRTLLGATAAGATAILRPRRARAQAAAPFRIGVLNDPNGVYADNGGIGSVIAARLAVEDVGGSVLGRPIEVLTGDNQSKPDLATSIARDWIDQQGVQVLLDGASSNVGLALQTLGREKNRIYIATGPATSDLTGSACSPVGFQFAYDTYGLAHGTGEAVTKQGGKTWFFITVDYAFGRALQRDTTKFVEAAGGRVIGQVLHPLGTSDFSSYLLQAQASGADVIALANSGTDLQNSLKQAAEFGLGKGRQHLAGLLIFITDVVSVGLPIAQGLLLTTSFYWDRTDATRTWNKRFMAHKDKPASLVQAGTYSAALHYLKAVQAAGTADTATVAAKMREMPVNDMNNTNVAIRVDGRVLGDMYLMQVKTPAESSSRFDAYTMKAILPGAQVYRPLNEGGCPLVRG